MGPITPDLLCSLANVQIMLGKFPGATPEDNLLNLLIAEVSSQITESCNRTHFLITNANAIQTLRYSGEGDVWLVLRQKPLYCPYLNGNTVNGSAVVTAIPVLPGTSPPLNGTTGLFPNQNVVGPGIQTGTVVQSVDSGSQVTLSLPATATQTQAVLSFGVAVWWDNLGYWQSVPNSFPAGIQSGGSQLVEGGDFAIERDRADGTSRSASLFRINQGWDDNYSRGPYDLAAYRTSGQGNYKVQACFGYAQLPAEIEQAALLAVLKSRQMKPFGYLLQSEGDDGYNYSMMAQAVKPLVNFGVLDGATEAILCKYRILAVPTGE